MAKKTVKAIVKLQVQANAVAIDVDETAVAQVNTVSSVVDGVVGHRRADTGGAVHQPDTAAAQPRKAEAAAAAIAAPVFDIGAFGFVVEAHVCLPSRGLTRECSIEKHRHPHPGLFDQSS